MYSVLAWEVERMSMLQIGILGVAGVLLALQFKSGKSEYLYQYRSWHADLCISAWKDQSAQRCTE